MIKKILGTAFLFAISIHALLSQSNPDRHSTSIEESWLSCARTDHPKEGFPNAHWIQYDLGYVYVLGKSQMWNLNHPDNLDNGTKSYAVDVSMDGSEWQFMGEYSLAKGMASGFYLGEDGPDFNGIEARYILITVNNNYGGDCAGFAEFKVDATEAEPTHSYSTNNVSFIVKPNPFTDVIIIEYNGGSNTSYEVYDIGGKKIMSGNLNSNQTTITTSDLTSGIYTLKVSNNEGFTTKKIIKQ